MVSWVNLSFFHACDLQWLYYLLNLLCFTLLNRSCVLSFVSLFIIQLIFSYFSFVDTSSSLFYARFLKYLYVNF